MNTLISQRKISLSSKLRTFLLRLKYGHSVEFKGHPSVFGSLPYFKIPGQGRIIIGDRVVLDSGFRNCNIPLTTRCKLVCGTSGIIEVGNNTILNGVGITSYLKITIGENCLISSGTFICDTDLHPIDPMLRQQVPLGYHIEHSKVIKKEIIIGNNVWVGWGAIILKGVHIGENSIIGAGSVVTQSIPANVIAAGNPATVIRQI